jgi:hypothetical protein
MPETKYRVNPFRMNSYQRQMLALPVFSLLFLNILVSAGCFLGWNQITRIFGYYSREAEIMNTLFITFLFVIWVYIILAILWMIPISSRLLGAFERLLRELDAVIKLKKKRKFFVRRDDYPANEFIVRLNKLIQYTDFEE